MAAIEKIKEKWNSTAGYKTATAGYLALIFEILKLAFGDNFVSEEIQAKIISIVGLVAATGILDKVWRNRKKIVEKIKGLFKKKA